MILRACSHRGSYMSHRATKRTPAMRRNVRISCCPRLPGPMMARLTCSEAGTLDLTAPRSWANAVAANVAAAPPKKSLRFIYFSLSFLSIVQSSFCRHKWPWPVPLLNVRMLGCTCKPDCTGTRHRLQQISASSRSHDKHRCGECITVGRR